MIYDHTIYSSICVAREWRALATISALMTMSIQIMIKTHSVNVQFIAKSSNSKTGAIPVTNSDRHTCPDSCKLKNNGCYASSGYYTRLNWDKVTDGSRGGNWDSLCESVSNLKPGTLWRHNVSGDLPRKGALIDDRKLYQLITANKGRSGFTYTHHNMRSKRNRIAIESANHNGFTINLSADNPGEADKLKALHIAPVVSIVPESQLTNFTTKGGNKVVICPAVIKDNVTCKTCQMCARPNRDTIIGFPAHGTGKGKIRCEL